MIRTQSALCWEERAAGAFAWSLIAATIGLGIGVAKGLGPLGALLFPILLPCVVLLTGPGMLLIGIVVTRGVDAFAPMAPSRGELWLAAWIFTLPLTILNSAVGLLVFQDWKLDSTLEVLRDHPGPFALEVLWASVGIVHGSVRGCEAWRTT